MPILTWLFNATLNWVYGKLSAWIGGLVRFFALKKKIDQSAKDSVQPLKDAAPTDGKAIDDATDSTLGGL